MSKILLDSNYYETSGDILRRNINPRAARFDTGLPGYSSFTQGSAQAWKGLRGGIGRKYQDESGVEECYWSEGMDASHQGGVILGPYINTAGTFGKAVVKIIDFNGSTYAIGDDLVAKWNTGTSAWDSQDTGVSDPIDAEVITDSTNTYLVVSSATAARYIGIGGSWAALTGCKGYLAAHDNKLYGFHGHTMNYSPAKDIDGTWDTCDVAAYFGNVYGLFTAKSQVTDEPLLCINTSEALWTFDPWVNEVYPYLQLTGYTYAGYAGMFWNSYIYCSSGPGIKKIAGSLVTDVGPDQNDGLPSGYQGYISDMCPAADGSWMVFSVNGGSSDKSSIFKRHGTTGGIQQIYTTAAVNTPITCLHYSPSNLYTNGRLWWGEGTSVKYCMMPTFNTDVTEISSYEYVASGGKLIYPWFRPLEAFNKVAIRVRATTKGCSATKYFTVYYRTNGGSSWTTLGTLTSSPSPTDLSLGSGAGVEFKSIQLAVAATTDSSTATPELRSLELDYDLGTKRLRGWTFNIKVGQHNAEEILDDLHTSQDKDTLLLFYPSGDSNQDSYRVKISNIAENVIWNAFRRTGTINVTVEELIRG